ncbi:MAG: D-alanyl-D-alanine carboxypeptidase/D-alanyl-D-alanine-endopeptidase [Chlamydiales bacterium]|nr:D-alanyl-D-alanine carboxypeptidase/D-alanyl-D-alanine-endopeptidase [Chlamydiales bacterium]
MRISFYIIFLLFFTKSNGLENRGYFQQKEFQGSHIGIYIKEIGQGKEICAWNADQLFVPSSLQKISTTFAALILYPSTYAFITKLEYEGTIDDKKILHGNVWIKGGGDPTLSLDIISTWTKDLHHIGIYQIDGKIILDPTCFESALSSPYWLFEDLGNYYGAGACGLTINHNMYQVTFKPGDKEGCLASVIDTNPVIPQLSYINEVTTGPKGSGDQAWVFGSEYSPLQYLRGTVPIDSPVFTIKAAIPDPVAFLGEELRKAWNPTKGIQIIKEKEQEKTTTLIQQYPSPALKEIILEMNRYSINLYAEHLLKLIGDGSSSKGRKYIQDLLQTLQVPSQIKDGSGIARTNLLTPKGFVAILEQIKYSPSFELIYDSLPEPGEGSLRLFAPLKQGKLKAKTGRMSNIYNLGGYLESNGKTYAFAIFCNHYLDKSSIIEEEMHRLLEDVLAQE